MLLPAVTIVYCLYFLKPLLWIWIWDVPFFPPRHESLRLAAPHDQFPHLCLLFSCRKTDCVHYKTTASSHLLPMLNWQWGTTTLPMGLNSILNTQLFCLSSLFCSFSSFSLCYIPPLQLTNYWNHMEKTDMDLRSLWTNWTRHYDHFVLCACLRSKTLTTRSDAMATARHLHATTLRLAWTTLILSVTKSRDCGFIWELFYFLEVGA